MNEIPPIVDSTATHRFEVTTDGHRAELVYERDTDRLVLVHTGVPDELEGRGIGGALVAAAIDDAGQRDLTVVPNCDFARGWLERHPEVADRARIEWPAR